MLSAIAKNIRNLIFACEAYGIYILINIKLYIICLKRVINPILIMYKFYIVLLLNVCGTGYTWAIESWQFINWHI